MKSNTINSQAKSNTNIEEENENVITNEMIINEIKRYLQEIKQPKKIIDISKHLYSIFSSQGFKTKIISDAGYNLFYIRVKK